MTPLSLSIYIIYMFKERNKNNIQLICKLDLGSHDSSIVVCNGKPLTLFRAEQNREVRGKGLDRVWACCKAAEAS